MAVIKDGKSLLEWTEYENISLWWFVHTFFSSTIDRVAKGSSANDARRAPSPLLRHLERSSFLSLAYLTYEFLASLLGRWISAGRTSTHGGKARKVLMISQNHQWRLVLDLFTGRQRKGDAFLDSIISAMQRDRDYEIVTTYPLGGPPDPWYYPILGLKTCIEKRRSLHGMVHKPFEVYWSLDVWRDGQRARRYFSKLWDELRGEIFRYFSADRDIDIDLLEDELSFHLTTTFPRIVEHIETARRMLDREKPHLILLMNEYGLFERAVVVSGKLKGIPVLAIQHGVIHPYHPGYTYAGGVISETGSVTSPHIPIPDKTAAYGFYHKEILTRMSSYPEGSVVVTGQPRYDLLHYAEELYDRERVCEELGLHPGGRFILWTTQTHGLSTEENERNVEAVYQTISQLEDVQLVVKLHPI